MRCTESFRLVVVAPEQPVEETAEGLLAGGLRRMLACHRDDSVCASLAAATDEADQRPALQR